MQQKLSGEPPGLAGGADRGESPVSLGDFEVLFPLAEGGMGKVYLGRKVGADSDGRMVVVKTLLPGRIDDEFGARLFHEEARVAVALRHPNIVRVYDVGCDAGTHYIAMEYVHGDTLDRLLSGIVGQNKRLSYVFAATVVRDVAMALDYAYHTASIGAKKLRVVHRDIKPGNIMVGRDGKARLIDFGIAYAADREVKTKHGVVSGTLRYMAPEQAQGARFFDGRTDQFSLGIVLWELCTGAPLFAAATQEMMLLKLLKDEIPPPSRSRASVPRALERVVMRMLLRDPAARYKRCAHVVRDLNAFLEAQRIDDPAVLVAESISKLVGEPLDRRLGSAEHSEARDFGSSSGSSLRAHTESFGSVPRSSLDDVEARKFAAQEPSARPHLLRAFVFLTAMAAVFGGWWSWKHFAADAAAAGAAAVQRIKDVTAEDLIGRGTEVVRSVAQQMPESERIESIRSSVKITSAPSGATVRLDGVLTGKTPMMLRRLVPRVPHDVELSLPGRRSRTERFTLEPGERRTVHLQFSKRSRRRQRRR